MWVCVCVCVCVCACVGVNKYRCLNDSREEAISTRQLPWDTAHLSYVIPPLYMRWVDEPTQELQPPSPCGDFSLLTNLPFTGSPQMALLILPIFKYKRPPGTTQEKRVYVCICHTVACRGLSQSVKTRFQFSIKVCFHHKEPPPSNRDEYGRKTEVRVLRVFKQKRFVLDKNVTVEIFYSEAQNIIQCC